MGTETLNSRGENPQVNDTDLNLLISHTAKLTLEPGMLLQPVAHSIVGMVGFQIQHLDSKYQRVYWYRSSKL